MPASDDGVLTFEKLQQAFNAITVRSDTTPELLLVSPEAMSAMQEMPGGPSWANYFTYLKRRYGIKD